MDGSLVIGKGGGKRHNWNKISLTDNFLNRKESNAKIFHTITKQRFRFIFVSSSCTTNPTNKFVLVTLNWQQYELRQSWELRETHFHGILLALI